jgi:hypothetical protein
VDENIGYDKGKELSEVDEDGPELGWQIPEKGRFVHKRSGVRLF